MRFVGYRLSPVGTGTPAGPRTASCAGRASANAFTLVELLVVIGIISVLIGILLPTLSGARRQANAIQCASNLRQLASGWLMYADANKKISAPGRLPTGGRPGGVYGMENGDQYRPRWFELLGAMNGVFACENPKAIEDDSWTITNPVFLCPEVPEWNNSRNYPYGYNYQFLGNARPKLSGGKGWVNYPVPSTRIKAAETVMALDCAGTAAGKPRESRTGYYEDGTKDEAAMGNKAHLVDPPRMPGNSDFADRQHRGSENRSGPDPRHGRGRSGTLNAAFCDGHVERVTPGDLGYVENEDGSIPSDPPGAHNRLFSGTGNDDNPPSIQ